MATNASTGTPEQSCLGCPSYLTMNNEILSRFGKVTGAPMCARYGKVLGRPKSTPEQNERALTLNATGCEGYGHPRPDHPTRVELRVAVPDPDHMDQLDDLHHLKTSVTACGMCKHFIQDSVVHDQHGWVTGMCAARGKLILPNRRVQEATGCSYREHNAGQPPLMTVPNMLLGTFGIEMQPPPTETSGDGFTRSTTSLVDPQEYESDLPVTDEEVAQGIRAWRKVSDPRGFGADVFLPIFRRDFFDENEQAKIPTADSPERPDLYIDWNDGVYRTTVIWRELDETPMLWGPAGVGKTEFARHMAYLMGLPFVRISITGSTELDDLAGKMLYSKEKGTYFQYGRVSKAWGKPCVMLVDEPNTGKPEVWEFIRPMTDNSKQLALDMNEGELLTRHDFTHLIMAANPAWDPLNVGTNDIADADSSRLIHFEYTLPPEDVERKIISNAVLLDGYVIDKQRLDFVMGVAELIRGQCKEGALSMSWGIRSQIKVARALVWFDPLTAYRAAAADMLSPDQQQILLDQVRLKVPAGGWARPLDRVES